MPDSTHVSEGAGTQVPAPVVSEPHRHTAHLTMGQYLMLFSVMIGASVGDALLSRGMRQVGPVSFQQPPTLLHALLNPWVCCGIIVLIGFMGSYMTALSWADLTFVQPATAFGNVVTACIGHVWLHEVMSPGRWLGIALIVAGVGFVANSPAKTEHDARSVAERAMS